MTIYQTSEKVQSQLNRSLQIPDQVARYVQWSRRQQWLPPSPLLLISMVSLIERRRVWVQDVVLCNKHGVECHREECESSAHQKNWISLGLLVR